MTTTAYATAGASRERPNLPFIIGASSVGTLIEWYDFYLYGVLAVFFSKHFFSPALDPTLAFIAEPVRVLDRVSGAAVRRHRVRPSRRPDRPQIHLHADLGADGRGDVRRRAAAGLRDDRRRSRRSCWSRCACCRVLRSGGEYGGAATYIAEHAPDGKRGFYTAWIQTTATMGIVFALLVILMCRLGFGEPDIRRLGLARAVPDLGGPGRPVGLYPAEARGIRRSSPGSRSRARRRATRRSKASAAARTGA